VALDFRVPPTVAAAVAKAAVETGESRHTVDPKQVYAELKNYIYEGDLKKLPQTL
jgi:malate dehydrogenase (oxaloacetate-decarboxylating)